MLKHASASESASASASTPAAAHESLTTAFASGVTLPIDFRIAQLKALYEFLSNHEQNHFNALQTDLHKHRMEALIYDIMPIFKDISYLISNIRNLSKPKLASYDFVAPVYLHKDPLGTVLIFGAFNFPTHVILRPLAAALAAGNTVCIKPSELTPASERFLVSLSSVLDPRVFSVVTGGSDVCEQLLSLRWDHIVFTGSSFRGRSVLAAAAKFLTPVTLELGGKSPAIVSSAAHVPTAVSSIVRGRFVNCGQICLAVDYCLVEDEVYDEFLKQVLTNIRVTYGNAPSKTHHYGRLVSSHHHQRVVSLLQETGGKVLTGGEHDDTDSHYVAPTVVAIEDENDVLMRDEIFGPILPVLRVKSINDAIDFVNLRPHPLALYLFTQDAKEKDQVLSRTRSGSVAVNESVLQIGARNSFLGGVGESGMGSYGFSRGFETFSHTKPVMHSTPFLARILGILHPSFYSNMGDKSCNWFENGMRLFGGMPFRRFASISSKGKLDTEAMEDIEH